MKSSTDGKTDKVVMELNSLMNTRDVFENIIFEEFSNFTVFKRKMRNNLIKQNILLKNKLKKENLNKCISCNSTKFRKNGIIQSKNTKDKNKIETINLDSTEGILIPKGIFYYPIERVIRGEDVHVIDFIPNFSSFEKFEKVMENSKFYLDEWFDEVPHNLESKEKISNPEFMIWILFKGLYLFLKKLGKISQGSLLNIISTFSSLIDKKLSTVFRIYQIFLKRINLEKIQLQNKIMNNIDFSQLEKLPENITKNEENFNEEKEKKYNVKTKRNSYSIKSKHEFREIKDFKEFLEDNVKIHVFDKESENLEMQKKNILNFNSKSLIQLKLDNENAGINKKIDDFSNKDIFNLIDNKGLETMKLDFITIENKSYKESKKSLIDLKNLKKIEDYSREKNGNNGFEEIYFLNKSFDEKYLIDNLDTKTKNYRYAYCQICFIYYCSFHFMKIYNFTDYDAFDVSIFKRNYERNICEVSSKNKTKNMKSFIEEFINKNSIGKSNFIFLSTENDKISTEKNSIDKIADKEKKRFKKINKVNSEFGISRASLNDYEFCNKSKKEHKNKNEEIEIDVICSSINNNNLKNRNNGNLNSTYRITVSEYSPCSDHEGPCTPNNCPCLLTRNACEKFCECGGKCKYSFYGCNCQDECNSLTCSCAQKMRECDPDICFCKNKRNIPKENKSINFDIRRKNEKLKNYLFDCGNCDIFLEKIKKTSISKSIITESWGLFAREDIEKDEFICEYIGELLSNKETDRRSIFNDLIGLNYFFKLNEQSDIDAYRIGNEMRFVNHSSYGYENTFAKIKYVRGIYRIGLFALRKITKGEELFFDYKINSNVLWLKRYRNLYCGK